MFVCIFSRARRYSLATKSTSTLTLTLEQESERSRDLGWSSEFAFMIAHYGHSRSSKDETEIDIGAVRQKENAESNLIVYSLADDSVGDFFDVKVGRDPVYVYALSFKEECKSYTVRRWWWCVLLHLLRRSIGGGA